MRTLILLFVATVCSAQWSNVTSSATCTGGGCTGIPAGNGFLQPRYDPVAGQIFTFMAEHNAVGIYSTGLYEYKTSTNNFTLVHGWGCTGSSCTDTAQCAFGDTSSWPGTRHPYAQWVAFDTKRNLQFGYGGVACGAMKIDMYYASLNANPSSNVYHQLSPGTLPNPGTISGTEGSIIYVPKYDMLVVVGSQIHSTYFYCSTMPIGGGTPSGVLNASQTLCDAGSTDNWEDKTPGGTQPPGIFYNTLFWDDPTGFVYLFGGQSLSAQFQDVWQLNLSTLVWTEVKAWPNSAETVGGASYLPADYDQKHHVLWYHQLSGTGSDSGATWQYSPTYNTWTKTFTGGPTNTGGSPAVMAYDLSANALVMTQINSGFQTIWVNKSLPTGDCSTYWHIDRDCDGYGTGLLASGNDPAPLLGPDADDTDPTVNTTATVTATYGSGNSGIAAWLGHLGYAHARIYYISLATNSPPGNDSTGVVNDPTHPFECLNALASVWHDGNGGAFVVRQGTYNFGANPHCSSYPAYSPTSADPTNPWVLISYPGEQATLNNLIEDTNFWPYTLDSNLHAHCILASCGNMVFDNLTFNSLISGSGSGIDLTAASNIALRHLEISGYDKGVFSGSWIHNWLIENSVFHDNASHSVYIGYQAGTTFSQTLAADFDFALDAVVNYPGGNSPGADANVKVRHNVIHDDGGSGSDPLHINSIVEYADINANVVHNCGGAPVTFQTGIYQSIIQNNLVFNNARCAVVLNLYAQSPDNQQTIRYNSIINNTFWVSLSTDTIHSANPACGIFASDDTASSNRWIKDITIQNNAILTDGQEITTGTMPFNWQTNAFPSTFTIQNNDLYSTNPLQTSSAYTMLIGSTIYNFAAFQAFNAGWTANIHADPVFTHASSADLSNPALYNFTLQPSSPAIGLGLNSAAPTYDILIDSRPNPPSSGAYDTGNTTATGCTLAPATLGPFSTGQNVFVPFIQGNLCALKAFSSSGTWPTGLTFDTSAGTLTGTVGGSPATYTPSATYDTATRNYSIVVTNGCTIILSPTNTPGPFTVGQSVTITGTTVSCGAGPFTWTSSSLPTGLSGCNSASTCTITGTVSAAGTFNSTISVTDGGSNSATDNPTIIVNAAPTITTTSLPNGTVGTFYSQTLGSSGGTVPLTWSISAGTLPASLNLNSSTGVISGIPTVAGTSSFTAKVTDANGIFATKALSITINSAAGTSAFPLPQPVKQ